MKKIIAFSTILFCALTIQAQDTFYSIFDYDNFIPQVVINSKSADLQRSVLGEYQKYRSAERDMKWVQKNNNSILTFWEEKGDTVLNILTELSGIQWQESEFEIYLLRFYSSLGSSEPLIMPIGGIQRERLLEVAPLNENLSFNLIFQLSRRILAQTERSKEPIDISLAEHPLLNKSRYRSDIMAMLLTIATAQNVLGIEETDNIYQSAFWKDHFPGRTIFETYLLDRWILTPSFNLSDWLFQESYGSKLVSVTRLPRKPRQIETQQDFSLEGLPIKGKFGFSIRKNSSSQLVVDNIDIYRLGYACGLRVGDVIKRVDGSIVRSQRKLIEKIYKNFESGGATVLVSRNKERVEVIFRPLMIPEWDDEIIEDYFDSDSLADSLYDSLYLDNDETEDQ